MPLINCEISLDLTWSKKCVISSAVGIIEFETTDTNPYLLVVTSSTEDNEKLLKQLIGTNITLILKHFYKIDT